MLPTREGLLGALTMSIRVLSCVVDEGTKSLVDVLRDLQLKEQSSNSPWGGLPQGSGSYAPCSGGLYKYWKILIV